MLNLRFFFLSSSIILLFYTYCDGSSTFDLYALHIIVYIVCLLVFFLILFGPGESAHSPASQALDIIMQYAFIQQRAATLFPIS